MDILDYTFLVTTILAGIAAIWTWYTQKYLPSQLENIKDTREHRQRIELDTLQKALDLLDYTVKHLLEKDAQRDKELASSLERMSRSITRLEDMMSLVVRDWSRMQEILGDIDIAMNEIKEHLNQKVSK